MSTSLPLAFPDRPLLRSGVIYVGVGPMFVDLRSETDPFYPYKASTDDMNTIARTLNTTPRFNGLFGSAYDLADVLTHSVVVGQLVWERSAKQGDSSHVRKAYTAIGAAHDAAEVMVGDIATPVKVAFITPEQAKRMHRMEQAFVEFVLRGSHHLGHVSAEAVEWRDARDVVHRCDKADAAALFEGHVEERYSSYLATFRACGFTKQRAQDLRSALMEVRASYDDRESAELALKRAMRLTWLRMIDGTYEGVLEIDGGTVWEPEMGEV